MITAKKVFQFIEGNLKMLGDAFHLLSKHEKEQVFYRSQICKNDCAVYGYCVNCGCDFPGKIYVKESCNGGSRFPDIMGAKEWEQYKIDNKIEVDELIHRD